MSKEFSCEYAMSREVQNMCTVAKGPNHGPAPIPEEGKWVQAKEITDISAYTHGVGWCAPQQGGCKLSLNVKNGIIEEALVETIGCSGMTHSAAMAAEILPGKTLLEALKSQPEPLYYSKDGVHPNENGRQFIGKLYAEAIKPLINSL